jgi:sigma-54 specific flagellar transcriptional regulator A
MKTREAQQKYPWARLHSLDFPLRLDALSDVLEEIRASHSSVHDDEYSLGGGRMIAVSDSMRQLRQLVAKVAPSMTTVLITGESGTGKEVVARELHDLSGREGPFVAVNCGAIPEHLLESELFGHERGAFTGAVSARAGRFEQASGGTFFLDEIGDMPPVMQVKLLRVLEERVIERVGGTSSIPVDIRLIAATHRDLPERIESGDFRADLFYRLSVFPIEIPPLRERPDDIAPLVDEFLRRLRRDQNVSLQINDDAMTVFEHYDWPGNVRELTNLIERLVVTRLNGIVSAPDLPWPLTNPDEELPDVLDLSLRSADVTLPPAGLDLKQYLGSIEKQMIERALQDANGVVQHAARKLGIGRTTLVEKIRRHDIN